ncbi:MAG TPA: EAL domain-containing protein [Geminicoccaceae bacterium]|nr:EAL domain-containing protein [Geminicoccaceae bacterium]
MPNIEDVAVLLVEDDEKEYQFTRKLLNKAQGIRFDLDWVRTVEGGLRRLGEREFDVCLVDDLLPGGDGLDLVRAAQGRGCPPPIILLSSRPDRELDLAAMTVGAADYLDKGRIDAVLLERSIRYALARRRGADRLNYLAQFDDLTGLANRALYQDRLERALAMARRRDQLAAVFVLDLNGFKAVNDGLGHVAGDRLLVQMAGRLRGALRETDTVARLGGDEFAIVAENLGKPEHAALVARKLLDAVAPPLPLDGRTVRVTASIGVALYPRDGQDATGLMRRADAAMYRAKAKGGNLCRFHDEALERHLQRGALMESDLKRALARGEIDLHYQPQVTLNPGGGLGLAALLRWQHPELGLIGAERFLPLAEDLGLIEALTDRMLDEACRQVRRWHDDRGLGRLHLGLPLLSGRRLAWSDLASKLERRFVEHGLEPGWLEIEVAEGPLLADAEAGGAGLALLDRTAVRLALDAYGGGPTSLRALELGALDTLKLGRDLLHGVPDDPCRTALAGAVIGLAKELGLRIVAEGVDGRTQLAFLRQRGCDAVQAFMSCPPLPAEACTSWLRQAEART